MAVAYTKRDANQFAKTYRYVRQAPIFNYQFPESVIGDGDPGFIGTPTSVEAKTLYFAKGKVDITRFAKIYSYIKRQPSLVRLVPVEVIDTGSVFIEPLETEKATGQFLGTSSITYTFERTYSNVPIVILTPDYGVNVFIESVSTTQVVIGSSSESEASVNIQIISTDT